jgi:NarL family two-component system sensor histidine kinase LiaS
MIKVMKERKLTSMIWRSMIEAIVFSLLFLAIIVYFLQYYQYLGPFNGWVETITTYAILSGIAIIGGIVFGYWQSGNVRRRLDRIRDSMLLLEKGNLSRTVPYMGEDEVGRLAEQIGRISKKWEEQVSSLQRLSTHNAELAGKARFTAIIEERQRLARELHDAVSQQLFAISMTATALGRTMDKDFEKAKHQVALIEEMSSVAQSEMRALLLHLRPVHLEGKKLSAALHELVRELQEKVPLEITSDIDQDLTLSKGIEDHLFRIVQEAFSNTLRHARGTKLQLTLKRISDVVILSIRDNGVGFDVGLKKQTSYGIVTMEERVTELGGSINIISALNNGTRIDIRIPIMEMEGDAVDVG